MSDSEGEGVISQLRAIGAATGVATLGPNLGEDGLELRLRAAAIRDAAAAASTATRRDHHADERELRARAAAILDGEAAAPADKLVGLDRHTDERAVQEMEDAQLIAHMAARRSGLEAQLRAAAVPGDEAAARRRDRAVREAFSAALQELNTMGMQFDSAQEALGVLGNHTLALAGSARAAGAGPRGYPCGSGDTEDRRWDHFRGKLQAAHAAYAEIFAALRALEVALGVTRRDYEALVDPLMQRG